MKNNNVLTDNLQSEASVNPQNVKESFTDIYQKRKWKGGGLETASGAGSTLSYTSNLRSVLESYLIESKVLSILDAPCGDFNWFKEMHLPGLNYIGMDIVDALIQNNQMEYGSDSRRFLVGDITRDPLPNVDIMLCRDCLIHLPFANCFDFFSNFLNSGIEKLLLTSHFKKENSDLPEAGGFRGIDFLLPPFNFPKPTVVMNDFNPRTSKKVVCLWTASEIREALKNT